MTVSATPGPAAAPPESPSTERRIQTVCLLVLASIAVGATLQALRDVMIPFALALFLALALSPVVDQLAARTRLSRAVSVGLTMLLGALLLVIVGGVVASSLKEFEAIGKLSSTEPTEGGLGALIETLGLADYADKIEETLKGLLPQLASVLGTLLSQGVTVLIFLMFLLLEQGRPARADSQGSGQSRGGSSGAPSAAPTMQSTVRDGVQQYISVKMVTSAVTGIAVGSILMALEVPAAVLFGVLTFMLNFIPTIGSVVAVALPVPVLLAGDASLFSLGLAVALPGAVQFAVGQIWENKLLGDRFDLRASVVLLGLVFWGHIWGIVGMILATPITAVLKTLLRGSELTRPVATLMGQASAQVAPPSQASSGAPGAADG